VTLRADDDKGFGVASVVFTLVSVILAFAALVVAGQAISKSNDAKDQAAAANATSVSLTEFKIDPSVITADASGLNVKNDGSVVHNLAIEGTDLKTSDLSGGESERLDVSGLEPGMYTAFCAIPGHRSAGMVAMLHFGGAGGAGTSAKAQEKALLASNDEDDKRMKSPVDAYVAQLKNGPNTKGVGAQVMQPTILPDGTKEFEMTAEIVDWEVEPGKTVRAWAYNGTVPGPTIKVSTGDKVRVVLVNKLPQSTAIHFHGIDVPNAMDGVPDVTQPATKPGQRFNYEFVAKGPAVGIYHSHHHAEHQVPDGLLGAFLIDDLPLPAGVGIAQEYPMVLNDAGVIGLSLNGKSFPATAPVIAKQGEYVLVHYMNEGLLNHPMHLHGLPGLVVAKDGFPVPIPYLTDTIDVAPGERYTILVHANNPGVWAWHCHILTHAEGDDGMFGMVTTFIVQ
jgi:FtsP/CotA-like multicopper oxidase with cupredoxin domain